MTIRTQIHTQREKLIRENRLVSHCGRWWVVTGSNRRPSRCKRDALPTELTTHKCVNGDNIQSEIIFKPFFDINFDMSRVCSYSGFD